MIRPILTSILAICATVAAADWHTDFATAQAKAKKENKHLLVEFTGSDWCKACIIQKKNVLSKQEFTNPAEQHFVLVELDFPRKEIPADVKRKNEWVRDLYDIRSFPTILFMTPDGLPYGRMTGAKTSSDALPSAVSEMEGALQTYARYQTLLDQAVRLSGQEKTKKLLEAYNTIPEIFRPHYTDLKEAIAKSDPANLSGQALTMAREARRTKEQLQLRTISGSDKTPEEKSAAFEDFAAKDVLPDSRIDAYEQQAKTLFPIATDDATYDRSLAAYKKALDLLPQDSERAKKLAQSIKELEMFRKQYMEFNKKADTSANSKNQ